MAFEFVRFTLSLINLLVNLKNEMDKNIFLFIFLKIIFIGIQKHFFSANL
jgi:hypothetical protein